MGIYMARKYYWWPWSEVVKKKWDNGARCPHCGTWQFWVVMKDSSFKERWNGFTALVSCLNHNCGKQVRLKVRGMKTKAEKA